MMAFYHELIRVRSSIMRRYIGRDKELGCLIVCGMSLEERKNSQLFLIHHGMTGQEH